MKMKICIPFRKIKIIGIIGLLLIIQSNVLFVDKNRAMTYNYFSNTYDLRQTGDFWQSRIENESPIKHIMSVSLQECISAKLQQIAARDRGVIKDISYSSFKDDLVQENNRRKLIKQNGGVVYGPVTFNTQMYYSHNFSKMLIDLKRAMARNVFIISDEKLRQEYENTKTDRYKNRDRIQVKIVSPKNGFEDIFTKIVASVENRGELENLIRTHKDQINVDDILLDDETFDLYSRENESLSNLIYQLSPNQSQVLTDQDNQMKIVRCVERSKMGVKSFEEVKDIVKKKWIDEQYQEWLGKMECQADIRVNKEYLEDYLLDML